ncbi:protein CURVATURE THYLAKOID 1B, chloroplastic-like [Magnolia sinica]|uniref:protein CURVATURE THYLAKOID 1B, chloroplastic-like n=1 Tax=Magnolia sinica TaxID=86752 RepID=UPI0026587040|nr:protein CURVATURE THYLAKOID 1B, chloroplastic-like [Magnolia sinica]
MASTSTTVSVSSSSTIIDSKAPRQQAAMPQCVTLPTLPPPPVATQNRPQQSRSSWKTAAYCRRIARNVMAMATGESQVMATATVDAPTYSTTESTTELPEIVKTVQEAWDKLEDKYAVTSLAVAGVVALWGSAGMISAIDRLPLVPGVLEVVGIGYSGWFAYKNLVFKPDREALLKKVKDTYNDILGSS